MSKPETAKVRFDEPDASPILITTIFLLGTYIGKVKAKTALQRCNGIMMWEKGQDNHAANSLLKAVCDTMGRVY